jgi:transcriptional regulator with XRE-family HTH domain
LEQSRPAGYSPTIRKRTLARRLVELRQACGLKTTDVQRQLGWSATKLNWIEKAKWVEPVTDQVTDLCELYGVEGAERDALIRLARESRQRGWWWSRYSDVFSSELPGFEAGASVIRTFENAFIPGLLQVPGYIEHIARTAGMTDSTEIGRHVDARIQRQQILTRPDNPCHLHAIIDENAIARLTHPGIRHDQLTHLADAAARASIDIQVLPFTAGVYPVVGEMFIYLSYPDPSERDIVYLETTNDDRALEEYDELERYRLKFDKLRAAALSPADTRGYLKQQLG